MTKEFFQILGRYMFENPTAENPFFFSESLGLTTIQEIVRKADGRLIEFKFLIDEDDNPISDLVVPFVNGKPLEGFEPSFDGWRIEPDEEDDLF